MKYGNAVCIGKVEAFELSGGELPTKNKEIIISRQVGLDSSIVYKEEGKYYLVTDSAENIFKMLSTREVTK